MADQHDGRGASEVGATPSDSTTELDVPTIGGDNAEQDAHKLKSKSHRIGQQPTRGGTKSKRLLVPSMRQFRNWSIHKRIGFAAFAVGVVGVVLPVLLTTLSALRPNGPPVLPRDAYEWYQGDWSVDTLASNREIVAMKDYIRHSEDFLEIRETLSGNIESFLYVFGDRFPWARLRLTVDHGTLRRRGTYHRYTADIKGFNYYQFLVVPAYAEFSITPTAARRARLEVVAYDSSASSLVETARTSAELVEENGKTFIITPVEAWASQRCSCVIDSLVQKVRQTYDLRIYLRKSG